MKLTDEKLQQAIDKGLVTEDSEDARAYKFVFRVLKKDPEFHVSLPFADRLVAIISKREEKRDYRWLVLGVFLSLIALIASLVLTNANWGAGVFSFLSNYAGLVLFGIVFILFLQWIDKRVISKKFIH